MKPIRQEFGDLLNIKLLQIAKISVPCLNMGTAVLSHVVLSFIEAEVSIAYL